MAVPGVSGKCVGAYTTFQRHPTQELSEVGGVEGRYPERRSLTTMSGKILRYRLRVRRIPYGSWIPPFLV